MPQRPDEQSLSLDRFRGYLHVLARLQLHARFQGKLDASDVVQETLLKAHDALDQFRGHEPGELAAWLRQILARTLADSKPFRRDQFTQTPRGLSPLWPMLLFFSAVMFLGDVAIRRVSPDFERMWKLVKDQWEKLRGREVAPRVEYMEKLKSRKAEVGDQIDRSRAATRFEAPAPSEGGTPFVIDEPLLGGTPGPRPAERRPQAQAPGLAAEGPKPEAESYTNRLLKAKNKVWEDREKDGKDKVNS